MDDTYFSFARGWDRKVLFLACFIFHAASGQVNRYSVSTQASQLARAGQVPVNGSSGQVRFEIPVETIRATGLDWPVSLQYAYNGLRLEQPPSEVGLGWSLSGAGGVVVREVRGLPDDHPRGYWGAQSRRNMISDAASLKDLPLPVIQDFSNGVFDSEPDRFVVSAGPLSFSFVIRDVTCPSCDESRREFLTTADPGGARIRFGWREIEITDTEGSVFLFSERETAEFTSPHTVNEDLMPDYVSAWHLTRIKPFLGQPIEFEYSRASINPVTFMEQYDRTASATGVEVDVDCSTLGGTFNSGLNLKQQFRELLHTEAHHTAALQVPYLTTLRWVDGSLEFERSSVYPSNAVPEVTAIQWRTRSGRPLRRMVFNYEQQARRLLGRVMTDSVVVHEFDYYPVNVAHVVAPTESGMLNRVSPYAQDFWGFANGKSNQSSIPEKGADRRPDFKVALQGALRQIVWPTGGTTEIDYEPNRVRVSASEMADMEPQQPNRSKEFSLHAGAGEQKSESTTIAFDRLTYVRLSHQAYLKGSSATVSFEFTPREGCVLRNCKDPYRYAVEQRQLDPLTAPRFSPSIGVSLTGDAIQSECGNYFTACDRNSLDQWIWIEPGTYDISAQLQGGLAADVSFTLEWFDPDPNHLNPLYFDVDAAGIRVAETRDCAGGDAPCVRRLYRYIAEDGFSSGVWLNKIDTEYVYQVFDAVDCRDREAAAQSGDPALPLFFEWNYPAVSRQFRTLNPLHFQFGSPVGYSRLELWDDEQASRGREVFHFRTGTRGLTGSYPYTPSVPDPSDGVMWRHQQIRAGDDAVVRETEQILENRGALQHSTLLHGLVIGRAAEYRYTPAGEQQVIEDLLKNSYRLAAYPVESPRRMLTMRKSERWESGKFVREQHYAYNDRLQLRRDSTVNSDGTSVYTDFKYPQDLIGSIWQALIDVNKTGKPVLSETYINGKRRRRQQQLFRSWQLAGGMVEQEATESFADASSRITSKVVARDNAGFPSEIWNADGRRTAIVWDINGRDRIAVAEGASIREIFFQDFENDGVNGAAHTGERYAPDDYKLSLTGLTPNKTYILQWWIRSTSGWSMQTREVALGNETTFGTVLTGPVDDVRFFPRGAQMVSYTIEPLLGVTSETDTNGVTRYFEYDTLGRLLVVRDNLRQILRTHQYHLAGQLTKP